MIVTYINNDIGDEAIYADVKIIDFYNGRIKLYFNENSPECVEIPIDKVLTIEENPVTRWE